MRKITGSSNFAGSIGLMIVSSLFIGAVIAVLANGFVKGINLLFDFHQTLLSDGGAGSDWFVQFCINSCVLGLALVVVTRLKSLLRGENWQGPADIILASHNAHHAVSLKQGILASIASFLSLSSGASLGQYGPIVHLGGLVGSWARQNRFAPKWGADIWLGCGVAAAISAAFHAPIAGIIFAHEAILRHFSARAAAPISISAISASAFSAWLFGGDRILAMSAVPEDILPHLPILLLAGIVFALVAILIMKMNFWCIAHQNRLSSLPRGTIVVVMLALLGTFLPEVLGLGLDTLKHIISQDFVLMAVLLLFCFKFIAVLLSVYGGFVGGYFSPALYLGAAAGSLLNGLYSAIGIGLSGPLLIVSGMAAVSACVIGAPVAVVVLVLELTMSYNFAVGAMICVVTASFIAHLAYGHSLFDKQLQNRNIDLSAGRVALSLSAQNLSEIMHRDFAAAAPDCSVRQALDCLQSKQKSELYLVDKEQKFIGKILGTKLDVRASAPANSFIDQDVLIFTPDLSLLVAIEKASNFVGESIPVINSDGVLVGVVTEADLFASFLQTQKSITAIEHG